MDIDKLFIESIRHWMVDGLDKFEAGLSVTLNRWSDGSHFKLVGDYCPLCIHYNSHCDRCPIKNTEGMCCKSYNEFRDNPNYYTCLKVVDEIVDTWKDCVISHSKKKAASYHTVGKEG